jgi:hypothetical protein
MFKFFQKEKEIGTRGEELPLSNEGLPDSYRPSGICPRCGKQSSFEHSGSLPVTFDSSIMTSSNGKKERSIIDRVSSLICRHCGHGVVVVEEEYWGDLPKNHQKSGGVISFRGLHWWPLPENNLSPDIPEEIANVFSEAATTLMANCPRASAVMSRRTLEAITVEKGEAKGSLAERLKNLSEKGILHPSLTEWAKEIRLIGNKGAHFDPIYEVSNEDAKQLITFIRELLKYLYELPAELDRRRGSR